MILLVNLLLGICEFFANLIILIILAPIQAILSLLKKQIGCDIIKGEYNMNMPKHTCISCIYFMTCGNTNRTAPCYGRKTKYGKDSGKTKVKVTQTK